MSAGRDDVDLSLLGKKPGASRGPAQQFSFVADGALSALGSAVLLTPVGSTLEGGEAAVSIDERPVGAS